MESRRPGGSKRNSLILESNGPPIQRRTSKKHSSTDRHGQIYPPGTTIRAVTPESTTPIGPDGPTSAPANLSSAITTSPRSPFQGQKSDFAAEHYAAPTHVHHDPSGNSIDYARLARRRKTLGPESQDRVPPSTISRTRNRMGSLQVGGALPSRPPDSNTASIGFPSIIPSPPLPSPPQPERRRLVKPPQRSLSPIKTGSIAPLSTSQSSPGTDAKKILQLMKTTCGRMHGILSFRTPKSSTWCSGYCAINVASGSLIYQMKGDVSHAKTLIPDLRGCQVRTLLDEETQMTFLDVSTHISRLGVHLRPRVPETFDSWLAALLCWQPIRPKGIQNKMTKPQSATVGERKTAERRRNSAINSTKDAAMIKVGKMLLWDKDIRSGSSTPPVHRRISTYKQQRSMSQSWRKVSCTLQENGNFKLFTEPETSLISVVSLSQLSRCSVQRLDPTVLDDEFCIAIFPQYTTSNNAPPSMRPVYLSMESRVLMEVWFVLLRAFTIPELYGPEQPVLESELGPVRTKEEDVQVPDNDLFRVERLLSLRVTEAKIRTARHDPPGVRPSSKGARPHGQHWISGNYYAEVDLDGEVRAKTAVKLDTSNPFWREEYSFVDLPAVLSSSSVLLKTRNPGQQDWMLVRHGSYDLEQGSMDPLSVVGDIEVSPLDTTYGTVELRIDDLGRGRESEKWWPILNEREESVGEMLIKIRAEELVVLMTHEYQPLSEILHAFSNGVTQQISAAISPELKRLSETLLNIFQVSGQAGDWIKSLVEDEIDGFHKESSRVSKFRYSRRIASNDSYDSSVEREVLLRDLGKSATVEANLLFRGNSLLTKAFDSHMRRLGKEYLEETLSERIRDIDESDPECEVDPNRVQRPEDLQRNWRNLTALTEGIWKAIFASASRCPPELRMIFRHVRACAEDRYGDFLRSVPYSSVSGFLFLRFFCPAILNPNLFGLLIDHPRPRAQRTLTLIAKSLQTFANLNTFGSKEPWMEPMNAFLTSHRQEFKDFIDSICAVSPDPGPTNIPPSYLTPITILTRLPATSKEGFPSLPYLIDQTREFATLINLWLDTRNPAAIENMSVELKRFNSLCEALHQRTIDCLNKAEQAERPSGVLEKKWEELLEQMGRRARISRESSNLNSPVSPNKRSDAGSLGGGDSSSTSPSSGFFVHSAVSHRGGGGGGRRPQPSPYNNSSSSGRIYIPSSSSSAEPTPPGSSDGLATLVPRGRYAFGGGGGGELDDDDEGESEVGEGSISSVYPEGTTASMGSSTYSLTNVSSTSTQKSPSTRKFGDLVGGKLRRKK